MSVSHARPVRRARSAWTVDSLSRGHPAGHPDVARRDVRAADAQTLRGMGRLPVDRGRLVRHRWKRDAHPGWCDRVDARMGRGARILPTQEARAATLACATSEGAPGARSPTHANAVELNGATSNNELNGATSHRVLTIRASDAAWPCVLRRPARVSVHASNRPLVSVRAPDLPPSAQSTRKDRKAQRSITPERERSLPARERPTT